MKNTLPCLMILFSLFIQCTSYTVAKDEQIEPGQGVLYFRARYLIKKGEISREENISSFYKAAMESRVPKNTIFPVSLNYRGAQFQFVLQGSKVMPAAVSGGNLLKFPKGFVQLKGLYSSGSYPVSGGTMNLWKDVPLSINIEIKANQLTDIGEILITEDYTNNRILCQITPGESDEERIKFLEGSYARSNVGSLPAERTKVACDSSETPR